jgi:hypothetical protein
MNSTPQREVRHSKIELIKVLHFLLFVLAPLVRPRRNNPILLSPKKIKKLLIPYGCNIKNSFLVS